MLKSLEIQNYALLDQVSVKFQNGLIVFTGETGAGKSIFIDALGAILGEKVDESIVRSGTEKAVVEAVFSTEESEEIQQLLKELDLWDSAGDLILRREIFQSGRTRAFANDTPINQPILAQLGDLLVDLHGQHEHQSLLKVTEHAKLLDQYGGVVNYVQEIGVIYQEINQIRKKLASLRNKESEVNEKKQLYEFQIEEINQISPQPGEEEVLLREEKLLQNSEKLFQLTTSAYKSLYEDENAISDALAKVVTQLEEIKEIDGRLANLPSECESARILVEEIGKSLQNYISSFEFNPDRLEGIRTRLGQLSGLKKKFRGTIEEVIRYRDQIQAELQTMSSLDSEIEALEMAFEEQRELISQKSLTLSSKRMEVAQKLKHFIESNFKDLGMQDARLDIHLSRESDNDGLVRENGQCFKTMKTGIDEIEFFLAANPGAPPRPMVKVASGGEISRVMLALKLAQADADRLPVMIFDEIDSGVSGRIAQAVGRNLKRLSKAHQIICITHLPQIASVGDYHFFVEKISDGQQTRTIIRQLSNEERTVAVARLLGGETISETHLESARQLIHEGQSFH